MRRVHVPEGLPAESKGMPREQCLGAIDKPEHYIALSIWSGACNDVQLSRISKPDGRVVVEGDVEDGMKPTL